MGKDSPYRPFSKIRFLKEKKRKARSSHGRDPPEKGKNLTTDPRPTELISDWGWALPGCPEKKKRNRKKPLNSLGVVSITSGKGSWKTKRKC